MSNQKECSQCQKTPFDAKQLPIILFGTYVLFASVYGTIELFKDLISLFK
jgi:hypothetical protein